MELKIAMMVKYVQATATEDVSWISNNSLRVVLVSISVVGGAVDRIVVFTFRL
jgi:hypothetical protein